MRLRKYIIKKKIKKIPLNKKDKNENNDINNYNKIIQTFYKNIIKKNKPIDFEKFQKDIFEILDAKYCNYNHVKKILNVIKNRYIIKNFIGIKFREMQDDYYNVLFNKNNLDNNNLDNNNLDNNNLDNNNLDNNNLDNNNNNNNNHIDVDDNDKDFKLLCIKENNNYADFIIILIDKVYKKFNNIEEDFILDLFTYYTLDIDRVLKYLKTINFSFKNEKYIKKIHYLADVDYFYLLKNHDIKYVLTSNYIITNFDNIDNIIEKYFPNPNYNEIFTILINLLIENNRLCNFNISNVGKWILNNYKYVDKNIKIKLFTLYFIYFISNFINNIDMMNDNEYKQQIINYQPNINILKKIINDIKPKKEFTLEQLIEADELIINILLKSVNFRKKTLLKNKIFGTKNIKMQEYDYFLDYKNISIYTGFNMIDIDTYISFINKNRLQFINLIINYVKKITNVNDIIHCKLFHNKNKIFTLDEKVYILKKIYSGKIKANELELFILNNNELACHFIKNISINYKYVKYAMTVGNLKFIETLCDLKYNFTTNDLLYITSDINIEEILKTINKYNIINFIENLDWYYHIKYILKNNNNNLDILKVIYNDDNQDLRDIFNKKIKEINLKYNFDELNNLDFNKFCSHIINNNIIFNKYDIYRLNCLQKRLFLLNYNN
jgi:hypothetical protein